jgi:hypothetical protein
VVSPAPVKAAPRTSERDPLVKVAVSPPVVSSDNGEWIRQVRRSSAIQSRESGNTAMKSSEERL